MAVDFEAVKKTVDDLSEKANELQGLVVEAIGGVYESRSLGEKNFTSVEKTSLVSKYNTLKSELQTLYTQLP